MKKAFIIVGLYLCAMIVSYATSTNVTCSTVKSTGPVIVVTNISTLSTNILTYVDGRLTQAILNP